jgi:hypothetical protein
MRNTVFQDMTPYWFLIHCWLFGVACFLRLQGSQGWINWWENLLPHIGEQLGHPFQLPSFWLTTTVTLSAVSLYNAAISASNLFFFDRIVEGGSRLLWNIHYRLPINMAACLLKTSFQPNSGKWPTWCTVSSIICLFESSACFVQLCAHLQEDSCINTTSGIITLC